MKEDPKEDLVFVGGYKWRRIKRNGVVLLKKNGLFMDSSAENNDDDDDEYIKKFLNQDKPCERIHLSYKLQ